MLYLSLLTIIIGTESFLLSQLIDGKIDFNKDTILGAILSSASVVLLVMGVAIAYFCFKDYIIDQQWFLEGIKKKPEWRLKHITIVPVDVYE